MIKRISQQGSVLTAVLIAIITVMAIGGGLYWYKNEKKAPAVTPPVAEKPTQPKAPDTPIWKTYSDNEITFSYPNDWEVLKDIPTEWQYVDWVFSDANWPQTMLKSKIFYNGCGGPILRNTKVPSTIIVFGGGKGDSYFCYSNGYFRNSYKRTITTLSEPVTIDVYKWQVADEYTYPITKDNTGKTYKIDWQGDLFETYHLEKNGKGQIMSLAFKDGKDPDAEKVFDKVISTLEFK